LSASISNYPNDLDQGFKTASYCIGDIAFYECTELS
jgi:hypothetical protein